MKISALFLLLLGACSSYCAAAERPNIVYILVDDMGYADCGFNGGKDIRTPNIDALAKAGTIFKSYYVQPLCSATRATLLTGRYPNHHGIYGALKTNLKCGLPLNERTLAEGLRDAGYTTAIVGKWHLGEFDPAYRPMQRGFEHQYGVWYGMLDYFTHEREGRIDWYRDDKPSDDKGYTTHLIAKEAVRLIDEQPAAKPLFLYVPFNAVHSPYQVPDEYKKPYANLAPKRQTLAGMLAAVDEAVGQIVKALKDRKEFDNTLFIFSSDNGGPNPGQITDNTPLRAGKGTIYEGGVRVSAFAVWPGKIPAGKTIDVPLHIADWYPTLLGIAGAKLDQPLPVDGKDISQLLTKGTPLDRDSLLLVGTGGRTAALREGDWKLVHRPAGGKKGGKGAIYELYNLSSDISETRDLANTEPERTAKMREQLDAQMKNAALPPGPRSSGGSEDQE